MGAEQILAAADVVISIGSKLAADENIQEFVCGNYADGTKRNIFDAIKDEHLSPEEKKRADEYGKHKNSSKKKKKKKNKKNKVKENVKFRL